MINYKEMGLTDEEALIALYHFAKPQGLGILHFVPGDMSEEDAKGLLARTRSFDYLAGRVMKVYFKEDGSFEEWLYDRDNGKGAALKALNWYLAQKTDRPDDGAIIK